jgi:uncharacterized protein (TIGR03032 family)
MTNPSDSADKREEVQITCSVNDGFAEWMAGCGGSLAISTYQANRLALVGWNGSQVTFLMREFPRPMGIAIDGERLALATRESITMFANARLLAGDYLKPGQYDTLYLPRAAYYTGQLNTHDLGFASGSLYFVNTRFCCLCRVSDEFSFLPVWQPSWVSELAPEDRCHLNGLALRDGRLKYVTALGETNEAGAWRATRATGGVLADVESGEIVARGLAMPHSPRWYDGRLWLLNSGAGELLVVDPATGGSTVVCTLPSFVRGLSFVGRYALVGHSRIREEHTFGGLPVQQRFKRLVSGASVVNLDDGREIGRLEFSAGCSEVYDVQFLPDVSRPTILNLDREAVQQAFTAPRFAYWLRPES